MYPPEQSAEPTESLPARVRPLWLFGGGALLAVVGMCALISLVIAVPIIWLTVQRAPASAQATQVTRAATLPPTVQVQTLAPTTGITLTPLLVIGTQAAATAIPLPTQDALRMPPDQLVRTYFQLVGQGRYDLTWPLLTDAFRQKFNCCAPNYNYSGYTAWWDSVDHVEFGSVNVVSQNGDRAVVYAQLYYVMNTGERSGVDSSPYIALVYDSAMGSWRFDDKRANP